MKKKINGSVLFAYLMGVGELSLADQIVSGSNYSGWRGGIGIAFGEPAHIIPDVTELGYEILWGIMDRNLPYVRALDIAGFRYWNGIVEISLKREGKYDFSEMKDKDEAARLAFDAWAELEFGVKGLSKYARIKYDPKKPYGDVYGVMDLSSENPLITAIINTYLGWLSEKGIRYGGIALDNAGKLPQKFLEVLSREFHKRGFGIATNSCPAKCLPYIDFLGNEGFPFSPEIARDYRSKGFRGILGEFTTKHLSSGELKTYLKTKLFNGIVWFGYTDGGLAVASNYSFYYHRPDVYDHHRWVMHKYIPLSRAVYKVGCQGQAIQYTSTKSSNKNKSLPIVSQVNPEGKVIEKETMDIKYIPGSSQDQVVITRYGEDISKGIYLYMDSANSRDIIYGVQDLGIDGETLVFDEFAKQVLEGNLTRDRLEFAIGKGPKLIQLGNKNTIVRNILWRIEKLFKQQMLQREIDKLRLTLFPVKSVGYLPFWAPFIQGYVIDSNVARSGKNSLRMFGGIYKRIACQYYNRQGAAQFVVLNQKKPAYITLRAYSKAENIPRSDLNAINNRRHHFKVREDYIYCMHLYLDYQDGRWPEIHTVRFSPGSHDWEKKIITVMPKKPVKTVLVLLELLQPKGRVWFDDIFLAQETEPDTNLLACPGFEDDDVALANNRSLNDRYEEKAKAIMMLLKATQQETDMKEDSLLAIRKEIESLESWVRKAKMERFWARELRDLADVKKKTALCLKIIKKN